MNEITESKKKKKNNANKKAFERFLGATLFEAAKNALASYVPPQNQDLLASGGGEKRICEKGVFRPINAKKIMLTFSQVPEEMTRQDLINALRTKISFDNYVVSREMHKATGGWHLHALLLKRVKFVIADPRFLDVEYQNKVYHGKYEAKHSRRRAIEYICKEDKNYETDLEDLIDGKVADLSEQFLNRAEKYGLAETSKWFIQNHTKAAAGGTSLQKLENLFFKKTYLLANMERKVEKAPSFAQKRNGIRLSYN